MPGAAGTSKLQPESNIAGSIPDTSVLEEKMKPPKSLGGARSKSVNVVRAAARASSITRRGSIKVCCLVLPWLGSITAQL